MTDQVALTEEDIQGLTELASSMPGASQEQVEDAYLAMREVPQGAPSQDSWRAAEQALVNSRAEQKPDWVTDQFRRGGEDIKEMVTEGIPAAVQGAGDFAMDFVDNLQDRPAGESVSLGGALSAFGKTAFDKLPGETGGEKITAGADLVTRSGLQTFVAYATGHLWPVTVPASGVTYDTVKDLFQGEDLSLEKTVNRFRKEFIATALPSVAGKGGAAVAATSRNTVRKFWPDLKVHKEFQLSVPENVANLMAPPGTGPVARMAAEDVLDALPIWSRESVDIWKGVDMKAIQNAARNPTHADQAFAKFQGNLTFKIEDLASKKKEMLTTLEVKAGELKRTKGQDFGNITSKDLSLDEVIKAASEKKQNAITADMSQELFDLEQSVRGDFFDQFSIIDPKTNAPAVLPKSFTLTEAETMLRNVYKRLEAEYAWNTNAQAGKQIGAGPLVVNSNMISGLRQVAKELKTKIADASDTIIKNSDDLFFADGQAYKPGDITYFNETIHSLIPFRRGVEMQVRQSAQAAKIATARQRDVEATSRGTVDTLTNPLADLMRDRNAIVKANTRTPEFTSDLKLATDLTKRPPVQPFEFGFDRDKSIATGLTAAQMQANKENARLRDLELAGKNLRYGFDISTFSSAEAFGDRIFLEDVNDQQELISIMMSDPTVPKSYLYKQISRFNDKRQDNELLSLPKPKQDKDTKPAIRLNRSKDGATKYSY